MSCLKTVVFLVSIQLFFLILPFVCELNLFLSNIGYGDGDERHDTGEKLENPRMWKQMTNHEILNCLVLLVLMFHILFELFTVFSPHFLYIVISDMFVFAIYLLAFHDPRNGAWWMIAGVIVSGVFKLCYALIMRLNPNFVAQFVHETYTFI